MDFKDFVSTSRSIPPDLWDIKWKVLPLFSENDLVIVRTPGWPNHLGIVLCGVNDENLGASFKVRLWDSGKKWWESGHHILPPQQLELIENLSAIEKF